MKGKREGEYRPEVGGRHKGRTKENQEQKSHRELV